MDELLKLLKRDGAEDPSTLARMLGVSEDDVRKSIAEYRKSGVIRGYHAIVNEDLLDVDRVRAVIEIKITPEREGGFNRIAQRIGKFSEVESLFLMSGGYDLMAVVVGADLKQVATFVSEKLATIEGVLSTATHFNLKIYKHQGVLMEDEEENERLKVSP